MPGVGLSGNPKYGQISALEASAVIVERQFVYVFR